MLETSERAMPGTTRKTKTRNNINTRHVGFGGTEISMYLGQHTGDKVKHGQDANDGKVPQNEGKCEVVHGQVLGFQSEAASM
jgi:hypothetical protein